MVNPALDTYMTSKRDFQDRKWDEICVLSMEMQILSFGYNNDFLTSFNLESTPLRFPQSERPGSVNIVLCILSL